MDKAITELKIGDSQHHFSEDNLPALIYYKCKEWWSQYSMKLIANLALQWSKILLLTWYPEAKEGFYQDTQSIANQTVVVKNIEEVKKYQNKQVIIIHGDNENLCLEAITTLKDIDERIIFIKNIDILHTPLITECLQHNNLILSGEFDISPVRENILKKSYNSIILFSQPKIEFSHTFLPIAPYTWYIRSKNKEWYVTSTL